MKFYPHILRIWLGCLFLLVYGAVAYGSEYDLNRMDISDKTATADCRTVQVFDAVYENDHVNISWQDVGALDYTVEYRKKGSQKWYEGMISSVGLCKLYNLQFNQEYEYRIGSRCVANDIFQYSAVKSFRTPSRDEKPPGCGIMPDVSLKNRTPVSSLVPGLPFLAGDFEVFVTQVTGSGPFTGEGYAGIPYLNNAQVAVTFRNIAVNTDLQLISGYVETKYDPVNSNMLFDIPKNPSVVQGGGGVGDTRDESERASYVVHNIDPNIKVLPVTKDSIKDNIAEGGNYNFTKGENGKYELIITDDEGNEHKIESETIPFTITDNSGNTYEIAMNETSSDIYRIIYTSENPQDIEKDSIFSIYLEKDTLHYSAYLVFENVSSDSILLISNFRNFFNDYGYDLGFRINFYVNHNQGLPNWGESSQEYHTYSGGRTYLSPHSVVKFRVGLPYFGPISENVELGITFNLNYRYFNFSKNEGKRFQIETNYLLLDYLNRFIE